jgi:AcrR family transcriptional regulator
MAAAQYVFTERGYAGTTLAAVADRAGLSRPAMHYHFLDKATLYNAVLGNAYAAGVRAVRLADRLTLPERFGTFMAKIAATPLTEPTGPAFLATSILDSYRCQKLIPDSAQPPINVRTFIGEVIAQWSANQPPSDTNQQIMGDTALALVFGAAFYTAFIESDAAHADVPRQLLDLLALPDKRSCPPQHSVEPPAIDSVGGSSEHEMAGLLAKSG